MTMIVGLRPGVFCRCDNHQFIVPQHPLMQFVCDPVSLYYRQFRLALDNLALRLLAIELPHMQMSLWAGAQILRCPTWVIQFRHGVRGHEFNLFDNAFSQCFFKATSAFVERFF